MTVILHCVYRQFQNNSCNKITFTDIPFHFILQQQILEDIIKAELKVKYSLRINGSFCVGIYSQMLMSCCVSIRSPNQFPVTPSIQYTTYTCSHMHHFQYLSITHLALYVSPIYWHPQNLLVNKYKPVTYLCTHMYVCIISYEYKNIPINTCMYVSYCKQ